MTQHQPLSARERRLVEMAVGGRPDAEIAVRLGTNVDAVRREITALMAARGLATREQLRSLETSAVHGSPTEERRRPAAWLIIAGAGGAALVIAAVLLATRSDGEPRTEVGGTATFIAVAAATTSPANATAAPSSVRATVEPTVAPVSAAPLSLAQHGDFRGYERDELSAEGFVDTGTFIAIPFNRLPAARSSFRAGFTAVEALEAGYLNLQAEGWHRGFPPGGGFSSTQAVGLTADVAGQALFMTFSSAPTLDANSQTRLLPAGSGALSFYATDDGAPVVILAVRTADGRPVPAVVDLLGKLWVRPAPVPAGPTADDTGELLEVAAAVVFGPLDPPRILPNRTVCGGRVACVAVVHHQTEGGLVSLAAGTASCTSGEDVVVELSTDEFTLRFQRLELLPPGRGEDCVGEFPRAVAAGDELSQHGSWEVKAFAPDGAPLHVAAGDGPTIYVGVERTIETCTPCMAVEQ